jgi:hypothetical protein
MFDSQSPNPPNTIAASDRSLKLKGRSDGVDWDGKICCARQKVALKSGIIQNIRIALRRRGLHARYKLSLYRGQSIARRTTEFLRFDPRGQGRLIQVERSRHGHLEPSSEGETGTMVARCRESLFPKRLISVTII